MKKENYWKLKIDWCVDIDSEISAEKIKNKP